MDGPPQKFVSSVRQASNCGKREGGSVWWGWTAL